MRIVIVMLFFAVLLLILTGIPAFAKRNTKWNEEKRERVAKIGDMVCVNTVLAIIIICILYSIWCQNIS